jgi:adenylate kinase family enzyme
MYKIGFCGAHGTGKTTLAKLVAKKFDHQLIERTHRGAWENMGVADFEKLPKDIRALAQNQLLLAQINREDEFMELGFVADRTVLDVLVYTYICSDMSGSTLDIFKRLVMERCKIYDFIVYCPIEFDVPQETLRANLDSRVSIDQKLQQLFVELKPIMPNILTVTGDVKNRMGQIEGFVNKNNN